MLKHIPPTLLVGEGSCQLQLEAKSKRGHSRVLAAEAVIDSPGGGQCATICWGGGVVEDKYYSLLGCVMVVVGVGGYSVGFLGSYAPEVEIRHRHVHSWFITGEEEKHF